ncbi:Polyadenylate-binding protein 4 [Ranunculus cassubicifolius]
MVPPIFKKPQITTKRDLRISGLDPKVTDTQLVQFFQQVAPVLSVKIFPSFPKDDLRVAHVTFSNTKEAINARDSLHLQSLNGRPVSIMLADPDHIQTNGCSRVFVKNLGPSVDSQHLRQVFSSYGPLLSCNLVQPKGYGYVQFQNEEDALAAIKDMCYQVLGGKTIFVSPFMSKKARDEVKEAKLRKTVFIKNLSEDVDCDYLRSVFERCGRVRYVNTRADIFGQCRGTGYVTYEVEDEAVSAVDVLDGHVHDGQTWHVTRASEIKEPPREKAALISKFEQQNGQTTELYVKNIYNIANDEKLEELFSQFGRITSCKGCNRGFGFVAFSTPEEANKAVYEMNGRMIGGKILYVSVARRKKETKSKMQAPTCGTNNLSFIRLPWILFWCGSTLDGIYHAKSLCPPSLLKLNRVPAIYEDDDDRSVTVCEVSK